MYKICVNKNIPTTCAECGLIKEHNDGIFPISTFSCRITGKNIGDSLVCEETLPEWCPIEGSVPKSRPKQSEEEKEKIAQENIFKLMEITREWNKLDNKEDDWRFWV